MTEHGYSVDVDDERCAKGMGRELHISPKDSVEICRKIKEMRLDKAIDYLNAVMKGEKAVPYKRHGKKKAHKKGVEMGSGGYPKKASKKILEILNNVEANAEYKGLDLDNLRIIHASANKGISFPGFQPRAFGRATPTNKPTTNLQIVVEEF